jgi:CubicO group peptidase (beta-lactamase class C family)
MGRYLKGFPEEIAGKVSVRQLLRMESGYGDYFTPEFDRRRKSLKSVSDYLDWFRTFRLEFEPGTQKRYSNVGYVLLGGIVESASGLTYEDYVRKHVFAPAGMKSSTFRDLSVEDPKSAIGYTNHGVTGERDYVETNHAVMEVRGTPAGGSFCTADDLLRFHRALRANRLLGEKGTTFLLRGYEDGPDRPAVRGIAGGAPGVSAVSLEDAGEGLTVIVLSNLDEPLAENVGEQLFRTLRQP